jgi:HAD superfamily hydrolase (TIGR01490 family)
MVRRRSSSIAAGEAAARSAVDVAPVGVRADPDLALVLDVPGDPAVAAFFDVDGTLMQGASLYHLARGLWRHGFFDLATFLRSARRQAAFRVRGVEDPAALQEARETALEFIRGRRVEELDAVTDEVVTAALAEKVWPGTRALARMHIEDGQRVWLVTATPVEVAGTIARRIGLTGALGTVAETRDGVYTGRLVGEVLHGPAKAEAVRALAEREGLDLSRCAAYSDSVNDLPLLELVGFPCAVNPDRRLKRVARERGWRVRDYRSGRRASKIALVTAAALLAVVSAGSAADGWTARGRRA